MLQEFLAKYENKEYISQNLYNKVCVNNKEDIPYKFNLDSYNESVLESEYIKYKYYFANMYKGIDDSIKLDKEQIKAILADEDYSLIIAGAGTGKTTTMASKVKYLVDIKKVDPTKIVVMSYTKKATEELEKRIVTDFGIDAEVTTFHSLGMKCIREIFLSKKCYVVDRNTMNEVFTKYFKENIFPYKNKVREILDLFNAMKISKKWVFGKYFVENFDKYENFDDYFKAYKEFKKKDVSDLKKAVHERIEKDINKEVIYTLNNELVKSKGEAIIANFLYCNNIEYVYEKIYEEVMDDRRTYKPDFTLNLGGEEVYIEYFGLSTYDENKLSRYDKNRKMKEEYHKEKKTKFIKIDYKKNENILDTLKDELIKMGFNLKRKSYEEIFEKILDNNPVSQVYPFRNFLFSCIETIKLSNFRNDYLSIVKKHLNNLEGTEQLEASRQFSYINEFYLYYQDYLFGAENYGFDFSDMIYYANKYIGQLNKTEKLNYDYLIIDEYQDISQERYLLARNIANKNNTKIVAVGDDWQSIYAFSGSKVEYTYNFTKYFPGAKLLKISKTYRNSQDLIRYTGSFIMENKQQIKKELVSNKVLENPIKFIGFDKGMEYDVLKKLILKIHKDNPDHSIMVLARKNDTINKCFKEEDLKDSVGTKIEYVGYENIDIDGMSIHKSKGLTSDEVIILGLDKGFPAEHFITFWLEDLFKAKPEYEGIAYAEERRVFYVGLTRTKNYVYLLVNKDPKLRSPFINEIYNIINEVDNNKEQKFLLSKT